MIYAMRWVMVLVAAIALSGCVVANAVVTPYTNLHFVPHGNINPDASGRSSPLVVRIYELKSAAKFKDAGFFDIYDDAEALLGEDLLGYAETIIRPARGQVHEMRLHKDTTHIGIVGAFRDIENAEWKLTFAADPRGYENLRISIDNRAIVREGR
ncbi:type VI secretion system lipoprotein TssJ [Marinobacter sp. ANT_B65]|uniref:type VI secretion system lipoprotein TssJ n=1 Tax=Marinobacter sp. ANT_B65 TaxID=2039467 RepID=UPI000BBEB6D9|nr:type VI secretion system lipoprotein TssJ [Marinobacter sp. ANT_B65]PCM43933.1 type VI secretion system lipoprotein TssJ [Marinobacter sp. ANT_B65]